MYIILTNKKNIYILYKHVIIIIFLYLYFFDIIKGKNDIINVPFLPNNNEYPVRNYYKTKVNFSHERYNFHDKYKKRKIFKINYNYLPYINIKKYNNLDDYAKYIYNTTGMLNITKLDYYTNRKNLQNINFYQFNHIHLAMSFTKNYTDISLLSIASILNTSNFNTYIHFHILGLYFTIEEIKKITNLRRINNKIEFIFYNAKQAEYDFELALKDHRGVGNYAKILIPEIVNNTNKILILDSGDILCQKDLSEIYFYDLEDNYFGWILDRCAGNYHIIEDKFMTNNFHPNTGVLLVNIPLFREHKLYKKAVFMSRSYNSFICPTQDILVTIASYKFKFIPLNYNIHIYKENNEFYEYLKIQNYSLYKYTKEEILNAINNPVIYHFYMDKLQYRNDCDKIVLQWLNYAKLAGVYEELKLKYPGPFNCQ